MKRRSARLLRLAVAFSLFQKGEFERKLRPDDLGAEEDERAKRIRCPQCEWEPNASARWYCAECPFPERFFGGCGTAWNTFDTGGRCPGCGHQWRWTACLACGQWSPHEDWYEGEGDGPAGGSRPS